MISLFFLCLLICYYSFFYAIKFNLIKITFYKNIFKILLIKLEMFNESVHLSPERTIKKINSSKNIKLF